MKKYFILAIISASIMPFAFWEMEGLFTMKFVRLLPENFDDSQSIYPDEIGYHLVKTRSQGRSFTYSFLYDNHTNYALLGLPDLYLDNFQYTDDLKDLSLFREELDNVPNAYYKMKSVGDMLYSYYNYCNERSLSRIIGKSAESASFQDIKPAATSYKSLGLEKTIVASCGVEIKNEEDKVELKRNSLNIELKDALMKYFSNDSENIAIVNAINYPRNPHLEKDETQLKVVDDATRAVKEIDFKSSILKRLKDTKILRVYNVLPDDNNKESILFGLAENLASERKFFWMTQVKSDLSVLLKG